jgi:RNA polymerase sigma factor for flagellar operon FliA
MPSPYAISEEERERLILEYLPKVRWIAAAIHERLPAGTTEEDLVSTGVLGLISAIDSFDPGRDVALWTYAEYKVRGAILDSVRGLDGVAEHKRRRVKQVQEAISLAEQRLGRTPQDDEIAAELGIGINQYHELLLDLKGVSLGSLDSCASGDDGPALVRFIADPNARTPAEIFERRELERLLEKGISVLPEPEQMVLHLYFQEELTLAEVGKVMSLHYSRVSQLKSQALLRLRAYMQHHTRRRLRKEA